MKLAIISDIHSNLEAFKAVLKDIKKRKIKNIYCVLDTKKCKAFLVQKNTKCFLRTKNLKARIVRVAYNIDIAANKILKNKLPDFLAKRLFLGT